MRENRIITAALKKFVALTGIEVDYHAEFLEKTKYIDGFLQFTYHDQQWMFAIEVKANVTRPVIAFEKNRIDAFEQPVILMAEYITPPIAELLRDLKIFFMDTAGNAYINAPPLYIFVKGNRPDTQRRDIERRRLFKQQGLRVIFALLIEPELVNRPYREIIKKAAVALGTVGLVINDLKKMNYIVDLGKNNRKLTDQAALFRKWVEAFPETLRPKLILDRFTTDNRDWWKNEDIGMYNAYWGGEVAAAKLTKHLKPGNITIYAEKPPGELIVKNQLRKAKDGEIEIVKPFWDTNLDFEHKDIVPLLLVYADLMATGETRNIETAGIIHDRFLPQFDR